MVLRADAKADNMLPGVVTALHCAGRALLLDVETSCGLLQISPPSWPRPAVALGADVMVGWDGDAATVIE